jgi:MSHA pilin protein MshA
MKRRIGGFTLIELVVTLSVIAILAALALPRYIALQTQARAGKAQAIYGGVRSAAALAHAQSLATNAAPGATIQMEGANVTMVNAYPTADAAGILVAIQMSTAPEQTANQVTVSGGGAAAGSTLQIDINGGTSGQCTILYTSPAAANSSPGVTIDTSAC